MLKLPITFEDFDGELVTEVHHFNLSRTDLVDLELLEEGGLERKLRRIVEEQDHRALIAEFKSLVLTAYGIRSEDGKRFIKNQQVREEFAQTAAYDSLFFLLATDDKAAANFWLGIVPKSLREEVEKEMAKDEDLKDLTPEPVISAPLPSPTASV